MMLAVIDAACVVSVSATLLWGCYCVSSIVRHIRAKLTRKRQRRKRLEQIRQQVPASPKPQWGVWFLTRCCQESAPTFLPFSSREAVAASISSTVIKRSQSFKVFSS